jgi:hypothetical protein
MSSIYTTDILREFIKIQIWKFNIIKSDILGIVLEFRTLSFF